MSDGPKSFFLGNEVHAYLLAHGTPPDAILRELAEETTARLGPLAGMQIAPEQVARANFVLAGLDGCIELREGPALETLPLLQAEGAGPFDLVFVDADKPSYALYYEELLRRVRPGGVILVDNVLWGGAVVDPERNDPNTLAIRAFNEQVARDERVDAVMLPISDGLSLLRVR